MGRILFCDTEESIFIGKLVCVYLLDKNAKLDRHGNSKIDEGLLIHLLVSLMP